MGTGGTGGGRCEAAGTDVPGRILYREAPESPETPLGECPPRGEMRPTEIAETLSVETPGGPPEALAVRLAEPSGGATARPFGILYCHGLGSSQSGEKADFFRSRAVAAGWRFCSFDFRGHGASGGALEGWSVSRNLADVDRVWGFLAERGWRRAALLGSSMGGGAALWWAARHPERVVAAAVIAPALDP